MKTLLKNMAYAGCMGALLCAASCGSEDEGVRPADITGLRGVSGLPGQIALRWDLPSESSNIHQVKVTYYDKLTKKEALRVASIYSDSINIPNTRQRYGEYTFSVQPFSSSGVGGTKQQVTATSGAAPGRWVTGQISDTALVALTTETLTTNAQEPTEGPIANLLDDSKSTFFHTTWSGGKWAASSTSFLGDKHYIQVDFGRMLQPSVDYFSFYYAPRDRDNGKPIDFDLYGSLTADTSAGEWFLIKKFTKDGDNLPTDKTTEYRSPVLSVAQPMQYFRLAVNETNTNEKANGAAWWHMSEFKVWTYKASQVYYDPEKEEKD
ncbi:MAG: carbohydrate-binding protein [Prevotellaceae bacterium]|jgi:hypothetical protein|nr:carbohydrate-binding protein [Prevotellaceae bacterium]